MTPKIYKKKFIPNVRNLAKKVGCTREHLHWVFRGNPAGKKLARNLRIETNGAISEIEAMYPDDYV